MYSVYIALIKMAPFLLLRTLKFATLHDKTLQRFAGQGFHSMSSKYLPL